MKTCSFPWIRTGPPSRRRRAGFTLVEVTLCGAVLVIGVLGLVGSITSSAVMGESTREITEAHLAARRVVENMVQLGAREAFARYNAEPADDPPGFVPGPAFDVPGLTAPADDADGRVGEIRFPVDPAAPGVIREDLGFDEFGLPRDLNADGVIDAADHTDDFLGFPVEVRVEWTGAGGRRRVVLETLLWES